MPLVLEHTPNVRKALKNPAGIGIDVLLLLAVGGLIMAMCMMFGQVSAPMRQQVDINLSFWSLPKYTMFSLGRGFAAYGLSLAFTLVYGTIAAHNHTAEKVMIPLLDVLQAIPVLGFLPGLVLALVHLFPTREIGLEIACVIMIFTAQAWNMTFSFHGSVRGIPTALREASAIQRLSGWQIFRLLEVPAAMIGLVWNSMMSMAGGWFFLTVNEAFTLNGQDFRLPGIGSYMNEAILFGNTPAMIAAIVAMILMIIAVDQIVWRPIVVWSQRFKLEDSAAADAPQSWVLNLFRHSEMLKVLERWAKRRREARALSTLQVGSAPTSARAPAASNYAAPGGGLQLRRILGWVVGIVLAIISVWGAIKLAMLLWALPVYDHTPGAAWNTRQDWISVVLALLGSFCRTTAAVVMGAAWALPVGILIGLSPKWSHRLQPVTQVLASFPAPMLFPLVYFLLVWLHVPFGIGCVALMLLGSQWYILFNVIAGASAIPAELKEAGKVYGMGRAEQWRKLYLPSVFPFLVTGLITAAGGAWNATIVSEYLALKNTTVVTFGLGSMISLATAAGNYSLLAASVVVMAMFVVLLNRIVWKRLYRLAESRYSFNT